MRKRTSSKILLIGGDDPRAHRAIWAYLVGADRAAVWKWCARKSGSL